MSFFVYHRHGACQRDPAFSTFPSLLDELNERIEDQEHTSVSLIHESEWGLSVQAGGYVVFENVGGDGEPRHMRDVPRPKLIEMMETLARGDLDPLNNEPWQSGY
jgi:hypothetical protein